MHKYIFKNYDELSYQAADWILNQIRLKSSLLLCFAAGNTPIGTYKYLVEFVKQHNLDMNQYQYISLDEWIDLNGEDQGSCRNTLDQYFFSLLSISESQIHFFDGKSTNLVQECRTMDTYISKHGGIDLLLLGLGINGHLGFNEPYTDPSVSAHITNLDLITQKVSSKYFSKPHNIQQGITLGIQQIMTAKTVILLASGIEKAVIVKESFEGEETIIRPASLLQRHPNFHLFLDEAAASKLNSF